MNRIGIDIGSTTIKMVVIDDKGNDILSFYERHNAKIQDSLLSLLHLLKEKIGNTTMSVRMTGSVGSGIAEQFELPFVQEVVAATVFIKYKYPEVKTLIDIGGEDSKVVLFHKDRSPDLRMNGNCAGGTGAFIDQMALLLNTEHFGQLAEGASHIYPIASRCGVFSKTDIQNLISKNVAKSDIAASVLHAIAVQVVTALSHGATLEAPILLCGGPFTFIPVLRDVFANYLNIPPESFILPEKSNIIPAYGAALSDVKDSTMSLSDFISLLEKSTPTPSVTGGLPIIFNNEEEHAQWLEKKNKYTLKDQPLTSGDVHAILGVDSGSTTTKIIVLDNESGNLLFSYYAKNEGDPINTVKRGLTLLSEECKSRGTNLIIDGSCSTGYGENLIKAAFGFDYGIVETIAHFRAAKQLNPEVSFLLDIGGQDMKAVFIKNGTITRIEINEACSSGCGSFIETFACSLGYSAGDFAKMACRSKHPADLGTRCTVFMNSKVKQVLREGYNVEDIAAGLSYSVVKNCLYKVLKLKNIKELGKNIVLQGGSMCNDSIVRAFEITTQADISRSNHPELMGAYGCALYASEHHGKQVSLNDILQTASFKTKKQYCKGCENNCLIERYDFENGNVFYSGNKCERIFNNKGKGHVKGENTYLLKNRLLFEYPDKQGFMRIGIPRCLNMYENYPFWHTLLSSCNIQPVLSSPSTYAEYEKSVCYVMSDNICFPAKVVHSHIKDLEHKGVDRILFPYIIYEKKHRGETNSYNCPIVSGYGEVVRNTMNISVPFDEPVISFKNTKLLKKQCVKYLCSLGVDEKTADGAVDKALKAQNDFEKSICDANVSILKRNKEANRLTIMLAGRPYHSDMLIQHKLSEMISEMGVDVVTDDALRDDSLDDAEFVGQWSFPSRILKAAQWTANQGNHIHFVQMTSFGCGPDAFLLDEIKDILNRKGKALTIMKIDDINNVGSMQLRIRSLIESLRMKDNDSHKIVEAKKVPIFGKKDKHRKVIMPFFTPFVTPFIPDVLRLEGYKFESLPISDRESAEYGLRYANNEICYPATLVVGDIVKALKTGNYNPDEIAIAFTQTGGQCRATNYLPLIKKALLESGFENVPVISVSLGSGIENEQPGFNPNWLKIIPVALNTLLYSDCLAQFYHATLPREKSIGAAQHLLDKYIAEGKQLIIKHKSGDMYDLLRKAAVEFDENCNHDKKCPMVGIVGEIYLKYNSYAHKEIPKWLAEHGIAVSPSMMTNFFTQFFVNRVVNKETSVEKDHIPTSIYRKLYGIVKKQQDKANAAASSFPYFLPFDDIFEEAEDVSDIITLSAQFGEGWLLPAEIVNYVRHNINNVISLQPFGCIANHIVSKGLEKRLKDDFPNLNLLSLDFDSGVSDANVINRLMLFVHSIFENEKIV